MISQDAHVVDTDRDNGRVHGRRFSKYLPWIVVLGVILFVAAIRIRLLQIPLERDEGEYAYMGQLMLQGIPPYLQAYNMKWPGIYAAYALFMAIFGQTIAGIHLGLLVVNLISIVLLFLLARRVFDDIAGRVAAASYAFLSLSPSVLGTSAHATQFIVPFALGGTLLLLKSIDSGKNRTLLVSGSVYGLAFTMKQHALFFIIFSVFYFIWSLLRRRPLDMKRMAGGTGLLLLGFAIPFSITCALLYAAGVFPKFWFWTVSYASQYVSEVPLSEAVPELLRLAPKAINPWGLVWGIAGIGLSGIIWSQRIRSQWPFLMGMTLFSFLTVCPGFYFRNHYFVTMLPTVGLLAGVAISTLMQFLSERKLPRPVRILPILLIAVALIAPVIILRDFFFRATPVQACRMMYGISPFPESIQIAEYIKNRSTEKDRIAVIGSEPQIYFYANRKSATGYLYVYGLMEQQEYVSKMQFEIAQEVEKARPKYVVFFNTPTSWVVRPNSDITIFKWAQIYLVQNYRISGFVDVFRSGRSRAYWDVEARRNRPASPFTVFIFERKDH